jgi:hypothetical protein
MPFIRPDEEGFEVDEEDNVTYTGSYDYFPVTEYAYKPRPFDPAKLTGAAAAVYAMLRSIGLMQFEVRYDGGHDEGFAHADGGRTADGMRRPIDAIIADLSTQENVNTLRMALGQTLAEQRHRSVNEYYAKLSPEKLFKLVLDDLSDEMAACLLGQGYGTGEYSMYGAFTADLSSGTLSDEESAARPPDVNFD